MKYILYKSKVNPLSRYIFVKDARVGDVIVSTTASPSFSGNAPIYNFYPATEDRKEVLVQDGRLYLDLPEDFFVRFVLSDRPDLSDAGICELQRLLPSPEIEK